MSNWQKEEIEMFIFSSAADPFSFKNPLFEILSTLFNLFRILVLLLENIGWWDEKSEVVLTHLQLVPLWTYSHSREMSSWGNVLLDFWFYLGAKCCCWGTTRMAPGTFFHLIFDTVQLYTAAVKCVVRKWIFTTKNSPPTLSLYVVQCKLNWMKE